MILSRRLDFSNAIAQSLRVFADLPRCGVGSNCKSHLLTHKPEREPTHLIAR